MFKNGLEVRGSAALSGSKVKQFQARIAESYPNISRAEWSSLIPIKQPTLSLDKTVQNAVIYTDSSLKQPLFFDPNGKGDLLIPTVYTLWRFPTMVRKLIVPQQVHARFLSGADLMIPGLQPGSELDGVLANEVVAVHLIGHDFAIAVGVMLMNEAGILASGGKGKCTKIYHVFGDELWKYGDQSVPNGNRPLHSVESDFDEAQNHETAPAIEALQLDSETEESAEPLPDLKQSIETATTEFLRSAPLPIVIGDAADAVSARDSRFNIRSTAYRTWDLLFRAFAKRGLVKIKDGLIVSVNFPAQKPINDQNEDGVDASHMDELLERALMTALRTRISDSDLPISGSALADHVYASTSNSLNVKNSSYKSFAKLFKSFAKRGLIKLKEHKNVVTLMSVNRETPELCPVDSNNIDQTTRPNPPRKVAKDLSKISVVTKFEPNKHVRFLFGSAPSKALFTMDECKRRLRDYVHEHGLREEQGAARLDDTLKEAIFPGAKDCPDVISMKDLNSRFSKQFTSYSAIVSGDDEPVFSKGTPPNIELIVDKVGQKLRTRIRNLEAFGLDPDLIAQQGQKRFACATSVKPLPGKSKTTLYEVMIQGRFDKEVCDYLTNRMQVPAHLLTVVRKDK